MTALYSRLFPDKSIMGNQNNAFVARSLNELALLYASQGRYEEAEPLYKEALTMRKALQGTRTEDEDVATSLNDLAMVYLGQGRYGEAEVLLKQALAMRKALQVRGDRNEDKVFSSNLVGVYSKQGRYQEAEALEKDILAIRRALLGDGHEDVASSLSNLAVLYRVQRRYQEAEALHKEALAIRRKLLGDLHPDIAQSLNNLAILYVSQRRYGEAESLLKEALVMRKAVLGDRHPLVASSLINLADVYDSQGRYAEAESGYKEALAMNKSLLGNRHPNVARSLSGLANLNLEQGNVMQAINFYTESFDIEEANLTTNLAFGAEAQKRDYLTTLAGTTNTAISLHLQTAPTNPEAAQLALTTILQRKGRILDALSDNLNRLRQNLTPAEQQQLDRLAALRTQLATLYYGDLSSRNPEQYRAQIDSLKQQTTQLEADLNRRSAEFRTANQPIALSAVQAQIPADAALVELVQYSPFNPKAKPGERWGKPRYAAYILSPQGSIQAVDLGEAETLDRQATLFRQMLQTRDRNIKAIARKLDAILMQPIRQKLGNTRNLLLSPDSQLNLIPFAALVDESDRYLVETYNINYLTSGRDLLRLQNNRVSAPLNPLLSQGDRAQSGGERSRTAVILANPDYADPGNPASAQRIPNRRTIASNSPRPNLGEGQGVRAANQRSTDLATLKFDALPGTAAEATAIAPKLPGAIVLTGTDATENALKQVQSPRILHIATHGFFLADIAPPTPDSRGPILVPQITDSYLSGIRPPATGNTENALLRSGLALAGFNRRQSGSEDGVLTAQEAAGLDLRGTQLVVLSACETGVGNVANGEGVYGLRRAFVLAGAESQLTSLWQVSDAGTKDLMVQYYDRLLAGAGRSDALRQTQLEFLKEARYQHPFYWASFIPSGDWRPLK